MNDLRLRGRPRGLAKAALVAAQVGAWRARGSHSARGLRILYWHRVAAGRDELAVDPARFERQLDVIERTGLPVADLLDLPDVPRAPEMLALTFDDGYRELLDTAFPALARRGWPAVVFVVPGAVDGRIRFPWYVGAQHPALLSWDDMRAVERDTAIRFEPHSLTHPVLPRLSEAEAWREIAGSKEVVERELSRQARVFAYPGGFYGAREARLAERAGFAAAVNCEYGSNEPPWDCFHLRRVGVDRYDTEWVFQARLQGGTDRPPPLRRRRRSAPGLALPQPD